MNIIITATIYLSALIALAVAILWLVDRLSKASPTKGKTDRAAFIKRLTNPDWKYFERHLQRSPPKALRNLFSKHELLVAGTNMEFEDSCLVTSFEPLDAHGLKHTKEWLALEVIPFASSDGDPIYLRPGAKEVNAVYITHHDGGDTEQICTDISVFVEKLRAVKKVRPN